MNFDDLIEKGRQAGLSADEVAASIQLAVATADRQQRESAVSAPTPAPARAAAPAPATEPEAWRPGIGRDPSLAEYEAMSFGMVEAADRDRPGWRERIAEGQAYEREAAAEAARRERAEQERLFAERYETDLAFRQRVDQERIARDIGSHLGTQLSDQELMQAAAAAGSALVLSELPSYVQDRLHALDARLVEDPARGAAHPGGFELAGTGKLWRLRPEA